MSRSLGTPAPVGPALVAELGRRHHLVPRPRSAGVGLHGNVEGGGHAVGDVAGHRGQLPSE